MSDRNLCVLFVVAVLFSANLLQFAVAPVQKYLYPDTPSVPLSMLATAFIILGIGFTIVGAANFVKIAWYRSSKDVIGTIARVVFWHFLSLFYVFQYVAQGIPLCGRGDV